MQMNTPVPIASRPVSSDTPSMRYRITHITTYSGREPISVGHNQAWIRPRTLPYQTCESFELRLSPQASIRSVSLDPFENEVATFSYNEGYQELVVEALSVVQVHRKAADIAAIGNWSLQQPTVGQQLSEEEIAAWHFMGDSPLAYRFDEAEDYARVSFTAGRPLGAAAVDLMRRIHTEFQFDPHATTISTPVTEVLAEKKGVCQDFAHVMLAMLRSVGVASRYVSGYIRTYPKPGEARLVGADASHAWVSLYCGPAHGWVDLDPTNNLVVTNEHVTIAWGRDYSDVPPLRGVFLGGGQLELKVSVDVEPLDDTPVS